MYYKNKLIYVIVYAYAYVYVQVFYDHAESDCW